MKGNTIGCQIVVIVGFIVDFIIVVVVGHCGGIPGKAQLFNAYGSYVDILDTGWVTSWKMRNVDRCGWK